MYMYTYIHVHAQGARAYLRYDKSARLLVDSWLASAQLWHTQAIFVHSRVINVWHNMNADLSLWFALETSAAVFLQHTAQLYTAAFLINVTINILI